MEYAHKVEMSFRAHLLNFFAIRFAMKSLKVIQLSILDKSLKAKECKRAF